MPIAGHNSGPACGAGVFPPALQVGLWVHSAIVVELLCTSTFFLSLQGSHGLPGSTLEGAKLKFNLTRRWPHPYLQWRISLTSSSSGGWREGDNGDKDVWGCT